MKKTILLVLLVIGGTILGASAMAATTASFSPATVNVTSGQSFNLTIGVDPQGIKNSVVKIDLRFPPDLLEVKSFTLASTWMALTQSGYDSLDNTSGILIKTGGYPGGFSSASTFGTVSFSAKKAGTGTIQTGNGCLALDAVSQNVFSGSAQTSVTITSTSVNPPIPPAQVIPPKTAAPPAAPKVTPPKTGGVAPPATSTAEVTTPTEEQPPVVAQTQPTPSLFASMGNFLTMGTGKTIVAIITIIVCLLILGLIIYGIYRFFFKKKQF